MKVDKEYLKKLIRESINEQDKTSDKLTITLTFGGLASESNDDKLQELFDIAANNPKQAAIKLRNALERLGVSHKVNSNEDN